MSEPTPPRPAVPEPTPEEVAAVLAMFHERLEINPAVYRFGKFDRPSVATLVAALDAVAKERDGLVAALGRCCQCRFEDGEQYEECHLHQCQRCVPLENGDPSDVTLGAALDAERERSGMLRAELAAHRDKASGDYWAWQGDGGDHLESLVCPVLIPAARLRAIIDGKSA